jgi:predicted acetyltransferase
MTAARPHVPAEILLTPPELSFGEVRLRFLLAMAGRPEHKLVPYYSFRIVHADGEDIGHLNLRVGDGDHVTFYAGHVGYSVVEPYRGHGYAEQACRALAPFARTIEPALVLTCDPDNDASRRTIEKLGARYLDRVVVPEDDPQYHGGSRYKLRYEWRP